MKKQSEASKGIAAIVGLTASFSLLSVAARFLNSGYTVPQQVYMRVLIALLLALVIFRKRLRWRIIASLPAREWAVVVFRAFVGYAVAATLISKASIETQIGHVAFIAALPFVPLLGFVLLKEKVTWWKVLFIVGSMAGASLLAIKDVHNLLSWSIGDIFAIIATLAFALSYIARKWHGPHLNNQEITTLTFVFGTLFLVALSFAMGDGAPAVSQPWTLWAVVFAGGVMNVVNLQLINYSFEHLDAVRGGNLLNLESAWGVLFGFLFYHEVPTLRGLIGGCLIVVCVVGTNLYSHREDAKLAPLQQETDT